MRNRPRRLIFRWIIGAVVGTSIIAITSPLFLRSYLRSTIDPVRGAWTLLPESNYRWRSEGYADTYIGPLGMPGKTSLREMPVGALHVALWGDSQAEGVVVADQAKIFAQSQTIGAGTVELFPLARSGEDVADWLAQIPRVDDQLDIHVHVILVVELGDLKTADLQVLPPDERTLATNMLAARFPAFVIQATRHVFTESDSLAPRQLRFSIGPISPLAKPPKAPNRKHDPVSWVDLLQPIVKATDRPIVFLYAPKSPQIIQGKVDLSDPQADAFLAMRSAALAIGIRVVDVRDDLRQTALQGRWPHGFHNGLIGSGHLNEIGNQIIAKRLVESVLEATELSSQEPHSKPGN